MVKVLVNGKILCIRISSICADGQPAEYVRGTRSGVVVKPGDGEALAKAVLYLKNNPDLARELGSSGRHYVEENLSIEKIGKEMMTVFNKRR